MEMSKYILFPWVVHKTTRVDARFQQKKKKYLFPVPQVPTHSLLVFLDDSFTLRRAIYVSL